MVNERTVAINEAIVAHVHESPDDERGLFVAKFPIIRTVPDALPRYAGMAGMLPGPDTSRR